MAVSKRLRGTSGKEERWYGCCQDPPLKLPQNHPQSSHSLSQSCPKTTPHLLQKALCSRHTHAHRASRLLGRSSRAVDWRQGQSDDMPHRPLATARLGVGQKALGWPVQRDLAGTVFAHLRVRSEVAGEAETRFPVAGRSAGEEERPEPPHPC